MICVAITLHSMDLCGYDGIVLLESSAFIMEQICRVEKNLIS